MGKIGLHKIVGRMFRGSMNLSELAKECGLSKSTVSYHMKNLIEEGIVSFNQNTGKYSVQIQDEIKNEILESLRSKKTIEQIGQDLKRRAKKPPEKPALKKLVGDKEFKNKLNDLLEYLYDEGLVNEISEGLGIDVAGNYTRYTDYWTLTFLGCEKINICHICKKNLDDGFVVAHLITFEEPINEFHSPLVHTHCYARLNEDGYYRKTGLPVSEVDNCDFCGLSLSEKRLRNHLSYSLGSQNYFSSIYDLMSKKEIESLNAYCKNIIKKQFVQKYGITPPKNSLDGDLTQLESIPFKINHNDSKKILQHIAKNKTDKKSKTLTEIEIESHKWEMGDFTLNFYANCHVQFILHKPIRSRLDNIFEKIEEGTKLESIDLSINEDRIHELFEKWIQIEKNKEDRIEKIITNFFGTGPGHIYGKFEGVTPGPYNLASGRTQERFGFPAWEKGDGFSFVKFFKGKKYHEKCYHSLQSRQDILTTKGGEKTK